RAKPAAAAAAAAAGAGRTRGRSVPPLVREAGSTEVGTAVRYLVTLGGGVALSLPAPPDPADLDAVRAAAAPLLELLADRGLTTTKEPDDDHLAH
ncbi:MAG TPA: hypothetical protein VJT31_22360, partial [Rugosimonospora sp.]|nr:hypothetical protein [Rugosimonospora sp.]